jgi:acetate kinase
MLVLGLNSGTSSLKFRLLERDAPRLAKRLKGMLCA